jgi:hypothetical protein
MKKSRDQFTEQEARQRTEAALQAAFNTPHKPIKDISKKRVKAQRKAGGTARAAAVNPFEE